VPLRKTAFSAAWPHESAAAAITARWPMHCESAVSRTKAPFAKLHIMRTLVIGCQELPFLGEAQEIEPCLNQFGRFFDRGRGIASTGTAALNSRPFAVASRAAKFPPLLVYFEYFVVHPSAPLLSLLLQILAALDWKVRAPFLPTTAARRGRRISGEARRAGGRRCRELCRRECR